MDGASDLSRIARNQLPAVLSGMNKYVVFANAVQLVAQCLSAAANSSSPVRVEQVRLCELFGVSIK